jgi:hypothetical protein
MKERKKQTNKQTNKQTKERTKERTKVICRQNNAFFEDKSGSRRMTTQVGRLRVLKV